MRACAKGGTGLGPPRSPTRGRKRGTHNERTDEKQGSGKRARDDYRRQRGVLSIPGALSQVLARWPITPRRIDFRGGCYTHQIQPDTITTRSRKKTRRRKVDPSILSLFRDVVPLFRPNLQQPVFWNSMISGRRWTERISQLGEKLEERERREREDMVAREPCNVASKDRLDRSSYGGGAGGGEGGGGPGFIPYDARGH